MTEPTDVAPQRAVAGDWTGLVTLCLAALSGLFSVLALVVALHGAPPPVAAAAHAATPNWNANVRAEPPLAGDAPRLLVAIELLLPHLPRGAPFPRAFAVAVALASGDAEVTRLLLPLAPAAAEGAPTLRRLAEDFAAAADAAVLAEMGFGPDAGWLARGAAATMRLGASLGAAGTPGLAALREAAALLAAGDAVAAEAMLATLPPATAEALGDWRAGLRRRVAADQAQARLSALALERAQAVAP
ncbi:hypothetical protein [Roseomonas fluvialis]|uniref:HEAT repeat domain-containing protein n=1 Tax=Roseomonas fluvialis TaxID=1750527 RepID=A0ABN6NWF0_9PROT|nr:hypothetical protein [Roseomonas fluvialis]BDG70365.1 hypothetical protein Rmf_02940 [Roseomonas fluvialis]